MITNYSGNPQSNPVIVRINSKEANHSNSIQAEKRKRVAAYCRVSTDS